MNGSTQLSSLADQYSKEIDNLEAVCAACRERRDEALRQGDSTRAQREKRLIELHEQQRGDLLVLAVWLRNYYGETNKGADD